MSRNPIKGKAAALVGVLVSNTSLSFVDVGQVAVGNKNTVELLALTMRQNALFMQGLNDERTVSSSFNNRGWTFIPNQIYQWKWMESLNISDNQLRELPYSILELQSLTSLNISKNQISSANLPVHLCKLPKLSKLSAGKNPFVEELPPTVFRDCASLMAYFQKMATDPADEEVEKAGRILVLGEEGVGKTTFVKTIGKVQETKLKGIDSEAAQKGPRYVFRTRHYTRDQVLELEAELCGDWRLYVDDVGLCGTTCILPDARVLLAAKQRVSDLFQFAVARIAAAAAILGGHYHG